MWQGAYGHLTPVPAVLIGNTIPLPLTFTYSSVTSVRLLVATASRSHRYCMRRGYGNLQYGVRPGVGLNTSPCVLPLRCQQRVVGCGL